MKRDVHQHLIVINNYFKFHEIRFKDFVDMVNFVDFKSIKQLKLMHYYSQSDET